jgi:hypothetical protein
MTVTPEQSSPEREVETSQPLTSASAWDCVFSPYPGLVAIVQDDGAAGTLEQTVLLWNIALLACVLVGALVFL